VPTWRIEGNLYLSPLLSFGRFLETATCASVSDAIVFYPSGWVMIPDSRVASWASSVRPATVSSGEWLCARGSLCVYPIKKSEH
jgi:hypothetical protein